MKQDVELVSINSLCETPNSRVGNTKLKCRQDQLPQLRLLARKGIYWYGTAHDREVNRTLPCDTTPDYCCDLGKSTVSGKPKKILSQAA